MVDVCFFVSVSVLTQVDWETMWRERLSEYARPQEVKSALGWSTKVTVEVSTLERVGQRQEGSKQRCDGVRGGSFATGFACTPADAVSWSCAV